MVPVTRQVVLDGDTPVSAFAKLHRGPYGFLLESLEGGERWARYTFLCDRPARGVPLPRPRLRALDRARGLAEVEGDMRAARASRPAAAPASAGGRPRPAALHRRGRRLPRLRHRADHRVAARRAAGRPRPARRHDDGDRHPAGAGQPVQPRHRHRERGGDAGRRTTASCAGCSPPPRPASTTGSPGWPRPGGFSRSPSRRSRPVPPAISPYADDRFQDDVRRIKEYIAAGDTFQTVLSRRLEVAAPDPFLTYRYLRALNPAPYLYYLHCDDIHVIGSSPEILVRVEDGEVTLRPIAGTRPRGATPEEDAALAEELAADPKERAEHLMLVDLGRNDVGRVAEFGSVRLTAFMTIERYSHVMHLVSEVRGRLRPELDAVAALAASFPAGTVSGAPKVRAMQIIDELEPVRRGPYAGAVGYIGWGGRTHGHRDHHPHLRHARRPGLDPGRRRASSPIPIPRPNGGRPRRRRGRCCWRSRSQKGRKGRRGRRRRRGDARPPPSFQAPSTSSRAQRGTCCGNGSSRVRSRSPGRLRSLRTRVLPPLRLLRPLRPIFLHAPAPPRHPHRRPELRASGRPEPDRRAGPDQRHRDLRPDDLAPARRAQRGPDGVEVKDLGSSNGTCINGARVSAGHLARERHDHLRQGRVPAAGSRLRCRPFNAPPSPRRAGRRAARSSDSSW